MKVDRDQLRATLERLKTLTDEDRKARAIGQRVDVKAIKDLQKVYPGLITELARRMKMSRQGIHWMMREAYGTTPLAKKEAITRLNKIVVDLFKETQDSINKARNK